VAKSSGFVTINLKHNTVATVPTKIPANWAQKLFARVSAEQVAALEIGQQSRRTNWPHRR
jgi:hypothetical protein